MPDLIAQGPEPHHRWRRKLPVDSVCLLGREAGHWSTPWDEHISRRHANLRLRNGKLEVEAIPEATNPIYVRGRTKKSFSIGAGEHFVIGATTFTLVNEQVTLNAQERQPIDEQTFKPGHLRRLRFRDAQGKIDALSRLSEIVSGAADDQELFVRLVNMLLAGAPSATAAAIVSCQNPQAEDPHTEVLQWDRRLLSGQDFSPSKRLICRAVASGESVVHVWSGDGQASGGAFTETENADWAFCTPIAGVACRGWALYVTGRFVEHEEVQEGVEALRDDMKFAEVAAATLSNLCQQRLLERKEASLRSFFSPLVLDTLAGRDPDEALAPREAEVSVLFCDLRGFSRASEQGAADLFGLLNRVSGALGVMTRHILAEGGVVGDFHGDAAMGFWGWPLSQPDAAERACRAALGIRADFAAAAEGGDAALADFRVGIGVATGRAVAGKIGTIDQVKVTVFGPVVNLASRLEGMTKVLRAPILVDEATAAIVRQSELEARLRRVARVRPAGMEVNLEVNELLPAAAEYSLLADEDIAAYEAALDALLSRNWDKAFQLLHNVPAEDRVKDFLTVFIAQHNRVPPPDWDGVIPLGK